LEIYSLNSDVFDIWYLVNFLPSFPVCSNWTRMFSE